MTEWNISLKCERCGTPTKHSYIKAKYNTKKAIGCKDCGLNTDVVIKQQNVKVNGLSISIDYPVWYC